MPSAPDTTASPKPFKRWAPRDPNAIVPARTPWAEQAEKWKRSTDTRAAVQITVVKAVSTKNVTMAPYAWAVRDDPAVKGPTLFVALFHASVADTRTGGNIHMTQANMGEKMGIDRKTVGRHQAKLKELGYLAVESVQGRVTKHRLVIPANPSQISPNGLCGYTVQ